MRRNPLNMSHSFIDTVLWVNFNQQMHMIRHDFHFNYIGVGTFCGFYNQLL